MIFIFLSMVMMCKLYGSQGQQRTTALSLKLAEIELDKARSRGSTCPLLDDVLSELRRLSAIAFIKYNSRGSTNVCYNNKC